MTIRTAGKGVLLVFLIGAAIGLFSGCGDDSESDVSFSDMEKGLAPSRTVPSPEGEGSSTAKEPTPDELAARSRQGGWQRVRSTVGQCTVLMPPGKPKTVKNSFGEQLAVKLPGGWCQLNAGKVDTTLRNPKDVMDLAVESTLKGYHGQAEKIDQTTLHGYPGRDVRFQSTTAEKVTTGRMRYYLIGQRSYCLIYTAAEDSYRDSDATRFLDSLVLEYTPPSPVEASPATVATADGKPGRYGFERKTDGERDELACYHASVLVGINCAEFSQDGSRVLAGTGDGHVGLFDVRTWQLLPREGVDPRPRKPPSGATYLVPSALELPSAATDAESLMRRSVRVVQFCPDGKHAFAATESAVYHWELASGKTIRTFDFPTRILQASYSPDGRLLAAFGVFDHGGSFAALVHIWDVASGTLRFRWQRAKLGVYDIEFSNDGNILYLMHSEGLEWIETASGETRGRYSTPNLLAAKLDVPHGRFFAKIWGPLRLGGRPREQLTVWDLATGKVRTRIDPALCVGDTVRVTRDGGMAVVGQGGRAVVWDLQRNTVVQQLPKFPHHKMHLAIHPDGMQVVTVGTAMHVWKTPAVSRESAPSPAVASSENLAPEATPPNVEGLRKVLDFQIAEVHALFIVFSPDDSLVALPRTQPIGIMLCQTSDGEAIRGRPFDGKPGAAICDVAFSQDGKWLISGNALGDVTVWDVATGQPRIQLDGHTGPIRLVSLSDDGSVALSCNRNPTRPEVFVWDVASGRRVHQLSGHRNGILAAALLPDGKAVTVDTMVAVLWNLETGQPAGSVTLAAQAADRLGSATFSPDGMFVLLSRAKSIELWDLTTGKRLHAVHQDVLRAPHATKPLALSPNRRLMLCRDVAAELIVWDFVESKQKAHIGRRAPLMAISGATFSRDGGRLVTAGLDHITLWEFSESPAVKPK